MSKYNITFFNKEFGDKIGDDYSQCLMIDYKGEVYELVHNGRGDYQPGYVGDWVEYKIEEAESDEMQALR